MLYSSIVFCQIENDQNRKMFESERQTFIFLCFFLNSIETTNHNETITDEGITTSTSVTLTSTFSTATLSGS